MYQTLHNLFELSHRGYHWDMHFLAVLLLFSTSHASRPRSVFYWNVPPYIWKENETVDGSFKRSIQYGESFCFQPRSEFYQVKGGLKGFIEALHRQSYVETDKGNISTHFSDAWIPLLNSSFYNSSAHPSAYFLSNEMVVIVPRYKIDILYKIGLGLLRSVNFVVLCLALALLAGIIVWLLVSLYILMRRSNCSDPPPSPPGTSLFFGCLGLLITIVLTCSTLINHFNPFIF